MLEFVRRSLKSYEIKDTSPEVEAFAVVLDKYDKDGKGIGFNQYAHTHTHTRTHAHTHRHTPAHTQFIGCIP